MRCPEGGRSKLSANDSHEKRAVSPKIGPDPNFLIGLPDQAAAHAAVTAPTNQRNGGGWRISTSVEGAVAAAVGETEVGSANAAPETNGF